jgi:hypothetical protein
LDAERKIKSDYPRKGTMFSGGLRKAKPVKRN